MNEARVKGGFAKGERVLVWGRWHDVLDARERRNRDGELLRMVLLLPDGAKKKDAAWVDEWRVLLKLEGLAV